MGLPIGVYHDAIAQAEWGLSGQSIHTPFLSGLGLITFGFLWSKGDWASCYSNPTTSWSQCTGVVTSWTPVTGVTTTWTLIGS